MQLTSTEGVQEYTWLGGIGDSRGTVQKTEFWPYYQMIYGEFILKNEMHKILWYFVIQMDHLISDRRPDLALIHEKREIVIYRIYAIPADHRVKLK